MNEQTMSELVSIIIPVYNSEKFLKESLESVINQTYKNIEIICINDGSTDNSLKILEQFSSDIIIVSQENHGLASAINSGISKMKGKWFKWFSPDDVMYPNTIETLVNEAKNLSDNTIIYSNWDIIDDSGKILREFHESNYNDLSNFDYTIRLLDSQQINVNTTLIPSYIFKKIKIRDLDDPVAIDYDFFLNCALLLDAKFHLISKPLIKYRIHSNQLSHKNIVSTLDFIAQQRDAILLKLEDDKRNEYLSALKKFQKNKSLSKKTMEFGLKIASFMPEQISDNMLTLYLNKIRNGR
jgi:glycosyltransferase involved in cell wall biosynthesis